MAITIDTADAPQVVGLLPEGVSEAAAHIVARAVRDKFSSIDGSVVRGLRIIPSSVSRLASGAVKFVANTTVEPKRSRPDAPAGRSKVIDSVVTMDLAHGKDEILEVRVPFLETA